MQFPVSIQLHRSNRFLLLIVLLHVLAAACAVTLPWSPFLRLILLALAAVSAWRSTRVCRFKALRLFREKGMECLLPDGKAVSATVLADSTVFVWLIVLRLRVGEERKISHLTLFPWQISDEQFRRLRIWLRWQTDATSGDASAS